MVANPARAEPQEFRAGTQAPPFFKCGSTEREVRGGLVSGEYLRHAAVSGKE